MFSLKKIRRAAPDSRGLDMGKKLPDRSVRRKIFLEQIIPSKPIGGGGGGVKNTNGK
jgi:hypothetical protein